MHRQLIAMVLVLVVIALAMPAHAGRLEDLENHRRLKISERLKLDEEILRTEGAIGEIRRIINFQVAEEAAAEALEAEAPAEEEKSPELETVEAELKAIE